MATPGKSSRWGSLLQQAVAGVEARLDTILAEGEPAKPSAASLGLEHTPTPTVQPSISGDASKSSSNNRSHDRLQERLAKAIAAKSAVTETSKQIDVAEGITRDRSPESLPPGPSSRTKNIPVPETTQNTTLTPPQTSMAIGTEATTGASGNNLIRTFDRGRTVKPEPTEPQIDNFPHTISHSRQKTQESVFQPTNSDPDCVECNKLQAALETVRLELEEDRSQHQKERHEYIERIDALQSKLQFLSRQLADTARQTAATLPTGSLERKLAEKDEKISLLMEEGQALATADQNHRDVIRKLKMKMAENGRTIAKLTSERDMAAVELKGSQIVQHRVDELERLLAESQQKENELKAELVSLRSQNASSDALIVTLKAELQEERAQGVASTSKATEKGHEEARAHQKELEDKIALLEAERAVLTDQTRQQVAEITDEVNRVRGESRKRELELKSEIQTMEGKLEAMRALAEEASSAGAGDSQAKLLRQIETLQSQYTTASKNWQGIETSFLSRIGILEREKDDAIRRESDMRRKARETTTRLKRQDDEHQDLRNRFTQLQLQMEKAKTQLDSLSRRAEVAESALIKSRTETRQEKLTETAHGPELADEGHPSWTEESGRTLPPQPIRSTSPTFVSLGYSLAGDSHGAHEVVRKHWKASAPSSIFDGIIGGQITPTLVSSPSSLRPALATNVSTALLPDETKQSEVALGTPPPTARILSDKRELFDGEKAPSSSPPCHTLEDGISVSTVAAGPSVQLVERMSAAIRRLEAEKMATREERTLRSCLLEQ